MQPKPLIPWIGGKRRLVDFILPLFPSHTCYWEGGWPAPRPLTEQLGLVPSL